VISSPSIYPPIYDAEEIEAPAQPKGDEKIGNKEWDCPTDFVYAMYSFAKFRIPPGHWRGVLNGWADCLYDGKCLASFLPEQNAARDANTGGKQKEPGGKSTVRDVPAKGKKVTTDIGALSAPLSELPIKSKPKAASTNSASIEP